MSRIHNSVSLCCLLNPDGKCAACKLRLCDKCFPKHFQKNNSEVQLKFLDGEKRTCTFFTSMKCSSLGRPTIYVQIDTILNL